MEFLRFIASNKKKLAEGYAEHVLYFTDKALFDATEETSLAAIAEIESMYSFSEYVQNEMKHNPELYAQP